MRARPRRITGVSDSVAAQEGIGLEIRRALPSAQAPYAEVDPFLLLDDFRAPPGVPGVPDHPHRGFEIITYVVSGAVEHGDSAGNHAVTTTGGLQRITAGRGIHHSEGPPLTNTESTWGLQFWIDLAQADKGVAAGYQIVGSEDIPEHREDGTLTRVLAGAESPTDLHTPVEYLDVQLEAGAAWSRALPDSYQGFVYGLDGQADFGADGQRGSAGQLLVLGAGDRVEARAGDGAARRGSCWRRAVRTVSRCAGEARSWIDRCGERGTREPRSDRPRGTRPPTAGRARW